jgi:hypothetical protein
MNGGPITHTHIALARLRGNAKKFASRTGSLGEVVALLHLSWPMATPCNQSYFPASRRPERPKAMQPIGPYSSCSCRVDQFAHDEVATAPVYRLSSQTL